MKTIDRFLRYISIATASSDGAQGTPTTPGQFDLAKVLADELRELNLENVRLTEQCFVYAELPATQGLEDAPCLGLLAHMDTSSAFSDENVKPQIVENYDGGDVTLRGTGEVLSPKKFPRLETLRGKTLITTDGTTLLGADDKAGIAEIMTALEVLINENRPHGRIVVAFTPDEETGLGIRAFDVKGFGADYAYTVDGGALGELSYENFNACQAKVTFHGLSVHPGNSKNTMINACLLAMEFNRLLPSVETPRYTEGREGFFHLQEMKGDVTYAELVYIVREHDAAYFEKRKEQLKHIQKIIQQRWGENAITLQITEQYRNMREMIEPCFFLIENARKAMAAAGFVSVDVPVRGGTDGAQLSYVGLPCPNLCTGGHAFHGPFEHIAVEDMDACVRMLVELAIISAKK